MTNREFYNAILEGAITEEIKAHAVAEIEKLDKRNASRSSKPTKVQLENEPIKEKILELLDGKGATTASVIAEGVEISVQKASALCRQMVEAGKLNVEEIKVPKKGMQKAYSLIIIGQPKRGTKVPRVGCSSHSYYITSSVKSEEVFRLVLFNIAYRAFVCANL